MSTSTETSSVSCWAAAEAVLVRSGEPAPAFPLRTPDAVNQAADEPVQAACPEGGGVKYESAAPETRRNSYRS